MKGRKTDRKSESAINTEGINRKGRKTRARGRKGVRAEDKREKRDCEGGD